MKISEDLTNVDKAQMWYYYAYVHFSQDKLKEAEKDYYNFLKIEEADPRLKANVIFSLAQIAYSRRLQRKSIQTMKSGFPLSLIPVQQDLT